MPVWMKKKNVDSQGESGQYCDIWYLRDVVEGLLWEAWERQEKKAPGSDEEVAHFQALYDTLDALSEQEQDIYSEIASIVEENPDIDWELD